MVIYISCNSIRDVSPVQVNGIICNLAFVNDLNRINPIICRIDPFGDLDLVINYYGFSIHRTVNNEGVLMGSSDMFIKVHPPFHVGNINPISRIGINPISKGIIIKTDEGRVENIVLVLINVFYWSNSIYFGDDVSSSTSVLKSQD